MSEELTEAQAAKLSKQAFTLEQKIKRAFVQVSSSWWDLARYLHEFHEGGLWRPLGYETLDEFLAQPDLGLSRRQFFRMTKLHRDLVVVRQIPESDLKELEPSKVREVAPAIMRGDVKIEDALNDAKELGYRDVKAKYRTNLDGKTASGTKPGEDAPLDAETEPEPPPADMPITLRQAAAAVLETWSGEPADGVIGDFERAMLQLRDVLEAGDF